MKQNGIVRSLTEVERRAVRRELSRRRRRLRLAKRRVFGFSAAIFAIGTGLTIVVSKRIPPVDAAVIWLAICVGLGLWSYLDAKRDLATGVRRFEGALQRNQGSEVRVQSAEVVEFKEQEDEGACYAFQLVNGKILFISGQEFYQSARFPNTDFSLIDIYDLDGGRVQELIRKHGRKLRPMRFIPASVKSVMAMPEHLEVIDGKVSEVEQLLTRVRINR